MRVTIITTGGTIAKTFDEADGSLRNARPVVELLLAALRLPDLDIAFLHILSKDSLDLNDSDRALIREAAEQAIESSEAVVIVHGTDTLEITGELLFRELESPRVPVILTGAMRPYEFRDSDAAQNMTEALLACRLVAPGIYVSMHNRVLRFPGVTKDRTRLTFCRNR